MDGLGTGKLGAIGAHTDFGLGRDRWMGGWIRNWKSGRHWGTHRFWFRKGQVDGWMDEQLKTGLHWGTHRFWVRQ